MMPHPIILVGGAALGLWLLLKGTSSGETLNPDVPPAPPPPPSPPSVKVVMPSAPKIDEAGKVYSASQTQSWFDEGYAVGYAHGSNGSLYAATASTRYPDDYARQAMYAQYYSEGYRVGHNLGAAEFASVDLAATKPTGGGDATFGKQPSKSAGSTGVQTDFTTTRGHFLDDTRRAARPRRW